MEKQAKKRKIAKVERISQEDAKKIIEKGDGEWKPLNHSTIANAKSNLRESEEFQQKQARQGSEVNLCDFEEYFVNDRPILVARCTSEECRKKLAQDWFLTHCGESHRYYGKTFHRHLSRSVFGASLRSAVPKKDKSQPSMTSYAVKVFQPAVSEEDITVIRKSMARLISSGCVPIHRFSTPEMIELVKVIVRAVSPARTDATTIENIANKICASARTLGRVAKEEVEVVKLLIREKAQKLAQLGCCTIMIDHQSINKGADVENKRLGIVLCITDESLEVHKALLAYVPISSSAKDANEEPVRKILADYGLLSYVEDGRISCISDFAAQNLCSCLTPNYNGCCTHTVSNSLNRTFTNFLSDKSAVEFDKAKTLFIHAGKKFESSEPHLFPTLNTFLRKREISKESAKLQAELYIEDDEDKSEDESDITELQNRYKFYPALGKDFLTSTRYRKIISSFNALLVSYDEIEALDRYSHPQHRLYCTLPEKSFVEAVTNVLKPMSKAISHFDSETKTSAGMLYEEYSKLFVYACGGIRTSTGYKRDLW